MGETRSTRITRGKTTASGAEGHVSKPRWQAGSLWRKWLNNQCLPIGWLYPDCSTAGLAVHQARQLHGLGSDWSLKLPKRTEASWGMRSCRRVYVRFNVAQAYELTWLKATYSKSNCLYCNVGVWHPAIHQGVYNGQGVLADVLTVRVTGLFDRICDWQSSVLTRLSSSLSSEAGDCDQSCTVHGWSWHQRRIRLIRRGQSA